MRIYIATTMQQLVDVLASETVPADVAFAVTPTMREWYVDGDEEELEYAAMTAAASASLRLLADRSTDASRRVVLALEVPDRAARPEPDLHRCAVRLAARPALADVVSVHVDGPEAEADVRAAVAALSGADEGDEEAEFVVDAVEDNELAWYTAEELPALVASENRTHRAT